MTYILGGGKKCHLVDAAGEEVGKNFLGKCFSLLSRLTTDEICHPHSYLFPRFSFHKVCLHEYDYMILSYIVRALCVCIGVEIGEQIEVTVSANFSHSTLSKFVASIATFY